MNVQGPRLLQGVGPACFSVAPASGSAREAPVGSNGQGSKKTAAQEPNLIRFTSRHVQKTPNEVQVIARRRTESECRETPGGPTRWPSEAFPTGALYLGLT